MKKGKIVFRSFILSSPSNQTLDSLKIVLSRHLIPWKNKHRIHIQSNQIVRGIHSPRTQVRWILIPPYPIRPIEHTQRVFDWGIRGDYPLFGLHVRPPSLSVVWFFFSPADSMSGRTPCPPYGGLSCPGGVWDRKWGTNHCLD